jgi:hypothetical protein
MIMAASRREYSELVEEVRAGIRAHVPSGAVVLVASKGDEDLVRLEGYRGWHFPRDEWGSYAGHHPASSVEAIGHLRHLYEQGARYLVFPATAAWWLDHYRELADMLASSHRLVVAQEGVCRIYELLPSAAFDAFKSRHDGNDAWLADRPAARAAELLTLRRPAAPQPLRVLTILARYGTDRYSRAEEEIAALFARRLSGIERRVVIVDNEQPRGFLEERSGSTVIGGDNNSREFSAFDRGIDFIGADIWSYDFVHFATSAFNTLYVAYLERFDSNLLQFLAGRPACVGHIDCYNEPIEIGTHGSQHWMRSCWFILPPTEVKALGSLVSVADGTPFFSGNPEQPFRADAPIGPRYREYILRWLTGDGVGQGVTWHSTFELTHATLAAFEQKARTILNEHLLSIRLRAIGCHLADVTWLSTKLRRGVGSRVLLSTSWREQLANRDRDALVLRESQMEHVHSAV